MEEKKEGEKKQEKEEKVALVCDVCGKIFLHRGVLNRHRLVHMEQSKDKFPCAHCGKKFRHKSSLERHQVVHGSLKPYSCPQCDKKFRFQSGLTHHKLVTHQQNNNDKTHECWICGKICVSRSRLNDHAKTHFPKEGKMKCVRGCGIEFCSSEAWVKHYQEFPECNLGANSIDAVQLNPLFQQNQLHLSSSKTIGQKFILSSTLL
jgi:uncharacterized Zn-finger protein